MKRLCLTKKFPTDFTGEPKGVKHMDVANSYMTEHRNCKNINTVFRILKRAEI